MWATRVWLKVQCVYVVLVALCSVFRVELLQSSNSRSKLFKQESPNSMHLVTETKHITHRTTRTREGYFFFFKRLCVCFIRAKCKQKQWSREKGDQVSLMFKNNIKHGKVDLNKANFLVFYLLRGVTMVWFFA